MSIVALWHSQRVSSTGLYVCAGVHKKLKLMKSTSLCVVEKYIKRVNKQLTYGNVGASADVRHYTLTGDDCLFFR